MDNDPIPPPDHIARYCSFKRLSADGSPTYFAFQLKPTENYLSVNWLEYLGQSTHKQAIDEIKQVLRHKGFDVRPSGKFAVLNVEQVCKYVANQTNEERTLSVLHKPEPLDNSHSGVFGLRQEENQVVETLIAQKVSEVFSAA